MQVHRSIDQIPQFTNAVITIGTFDGVHQGHRKIIDALVQEARSINGEAIIISFDPHPRKIVQPNERLQLINTPAEKTELLAGTGIDHLVIIPFDQVFASLTAHEYIEQFLIKKFQPHTIIIGYDHHFGKGRQGNFMLLAEKADQYNYRLLEIPKYMLDEAAVSSTKIRNALLQSDCDMANKLLGYPFFFEGVVIEGDQLGRKLGYPTANLRYTNQDKIHLGYGVFAARAVVEGIQYKGMLSIGNRPTIDHSDERVEINIFDFGQEIYGSEVRVIVQKFLRRQERYASLKELQDQLAIDKVNSLNVLSDFD